MSRGTLGEWKLPEGVQLETAFASGMEVGEGALLGVLVTKHTSRPACVVRAIAALNELEIGGVETDAAACIEQLGDPTFWTGGVVAGKD